MTSHSPRRRSRLLRLLLPFLPLVVLIVLAEIVLRALGLGDPDDSGARDLSRGFDPTASYLVPDEAGGWRTQIFGGLKRAEIVVPPRDERLRVLLIGESNVQILPHEYLEGVLNERAPGRGWEVVNLGRQGYGSERLSILLRQAMVLEPDVVVLYLGHNEFVEHGFQQELERGWAHRWIARAARLCASLRLFHFTASLLGEQPAPDVLDTQRLPEPIQKTAPGTKKRADPGSLQIPWEETLRYWEAYRRNLVQMCRVARESGARVVLCTLVGNHLWPPMVSTLPTDLSAAEAEPFRRLAAEGLEAIPERWRAELFPPRRFSVQPWYDGTSNAQALWTPRLRPLSGPLVHAPQTFGESHSPAGAHWPPPERWDEDVLAVLAAMERLMARELGEGERERLAEASRLLDEALAIVPEHPESLFARGLVTWLLAQDDAAAVQLFARAAAFDRAPKCGNDTSNAIVRKVAESEGAVLLDAERLFGERTPDGLFGYELLMDACHLQPGVRFVLLDDLAAVLLPMRLEEG